MMRKQLVNNNACVRLNLHMSYQTAKYACSLLGAGGLELLGYPFYRGILKFQTTNFEPQQMPLRQMHNGINPHLPKDASQRKHMIIHTSYKSIVYLYVYIYILYIIIYIFAFSSYFCFGTKSLSGPLPDVGVDLVLPGHPLPEIFGSHLAACQVKNVEHHTLRTVPRTGGRTKESACKLVVTDMPAQELPQME